MSKQQQDATKRDGPQLLMWIWVAVVQLLLHNHAVPTINC
jgi:hypothetical protein